MNQTETIESLKQELIVAKQREAQAKADRLAVEERIVAIAPKQDEGTVSLDDTLSVTFKLTRTVDTAKVQQAWGYLSENAQKAFRWSADLDTKHYRALQQLDPQTLAQISPFITTKPAKAAVTFKE